APDENGLVQVLGPGRIDRDQRQVSGVPVVPGQWSAESLLDLGQGGVRVTGGQAQLGPDAGEIQRGLLGGGHSGATRWALRRRHGRSVLPVPAPFRFVRCFGAGPRYLQRLGGGFPVRVGAESVQRSTARLRLHLVVFQTVVPIAAGHTSSLARLSTCVTSRASRSDQTPRVAGEPTTRRAELTTAAKAVPREWAGNRRAPAAGSGPSRRRAPVWSRGSRRGARPACGTRVRRRHRLRPCNRLRRAVPRRDRSTARTGTEPPGRSATAGARRPGGTRPADCASAAAKAAASPRPGSAAAPRTRRQRRAVP